MDAETTDYKESIRKFVVDNFLFGEGGQLKDDTSFLDGGVISSTGVLELAMYIENTFGIKVKDDEMVPENLDSINAVASFLQKNSP
jgi:acyl carrier protein